MKDYLEIFEKFKDIKDINDYIDEVKKLRHYYAMGQFQEMQKHIRFLIEKYTLEAFVWNTVNRDAPTTYDQAYINAENFMCAQGARLVVEKFHDFRMRLSEEESTFIESIIKPRG